MRNYTAVRNISVIYKIRSIIILAERRACSTYESA